MSVSITRAEGVTVVTVNSDSSSLCPPLCQILRGLCYNPVCCSVSQQLRRLHSGGGQVLLGALHILTGLLSIGLAVVVTVSRAWWYMDFIAFPYWLGGLFVAFGIMAILSEKFPSPCLVILNVVLQLTGICFSIAAVILHSININAMNLWSFCRNDDYYHSYDYDSYGFRHHHTTASPSPQDIALMESCLQAKHLTWMVLLGITILLIVLSVLELCLTISSTVLGIKALKSFGKNQQTDEDPEASKPLID